MKKNDSGSNLKKTSEKKPLQPIGLVMTESDFQALQIIRQRCMNVGIDTTKSEVLRAGILSLQGLSDDSLKEALLAVEKLKPGRRTF